MGGSVSSAVQVFETTMVNRIKNNCPKTIAKTKMNIGPLVITGDRNTWEASQKAVASGDCVITNAIDTAAEQIANASAEAKAGLLFAASSTVQDVKQRLENITENECGGSIAALEQNSEAQIITGNDNKTLLNQEGDAKSRCVLRSINRMMSEMDGDAASKASGLDPTVLLIAIVIIALIGGGAFLILRNRLAL